MVEVADRSANTFLPIIQTYIRPGTTVFSDEWRAYSQITSLGLSHSTVNHSINFVDPLMVHIHKILNPHGPSLRIL